MKNETFRKIASTRTYNYQMNNERYSWENKHRLVRSNETAIAGKTGFTKAAGRTLVTYFEKDGKKIIVVTLNDGNDWNTHRQLSEDVFSNYELVTVAKKGRYSILPGMEGELDKPIKLLLKKGEKNNVSHIVRIPRGKQKRVLDDGQSISITNPLITSEITLTR